MISERYNLLKGFAELYFFLVFFVVSPATATAYFAFSFFSTTAEAVWKKQKVNGGRYPPVVIINHRVPLKSPQLLCILLHPFKRIAKHSDNKVDQQEVGK